MKIVFITLYDLQDINRGSGTYYHLYKELIKQGHTVEPIKVSNFKFPFLSKMFRYISKRIFNKKYRSYQDPFVGKEISKKSTISLGKIDFDLVLTNDYTVAAYTVVEKPIILWTDAVFPSDYKTNTHPWLANLSFFSVYFCQTIIRKALKNCSLCIVPGDWNRTELEKYNSINTDSIIVIPFGSNMPDPGVEIANERDFNNVIKRGELRLLFVGKDWSRKGGNIAVSVVRELNKIGHNTILNIVGVDRIDDIDDSFIQFHGILSKHSKKDMKILDRLYQKSDIFFLPSSIEGFGIAYTEAASYGLPSLGFRSTGVLTAVQNGITGLLINIDSDYGKYIDVIKRWYEIPEEYNKLSEGGRKLYLSTMNWPRSIKNFINHIERI